MSQVMVGYKVKPARAARLGGPCGAGNPAAAKRSLEALAFTGDAIVTDVATTTGPLGNAEER
jgi:hypothetical protein